MSKLRNWCFTLNNYSVEEYEKIINIECKYIIVGKEKGEQGTEHLQGYIEFVNSKRLETLKKINNRIHWESRKGTAIEASEYCKKEGEYIEKGELRKEQGKRSDIDEIKELAMNGGTRREAFAIARSYQSYRMFEVGKSLFCKKRDFKPKVIWIWGPTGSGKSKMARELAEGEYYENLRDNYKWWCGYDAHETVIIDDFRDSWAPFNVLLKLLDRYGYTLETKGGSTELLAKVMIITSCKPPEEFYKGIGEDRNQLYRRIDEIIKTEQAPEVGGNTNTPTWDEL